MKIKFWGVRGSIPTPSDKDFSTAHYGGNTACVSIENDDEILIIDGGTGIRNLGDLLMGFNKEGEIVEETQYSKKGGNINIFISHLHIDHLQGLNFFKPLFRPDINVTLYGFEGLKDICTILSSEPLFPVNYHTINPNITYKTLDYYDTIELNNKIKVTSLKLNHPGGCMGFMIENGSSKVIYATDNEHQSMLDGKLVECIKDADILIYDTQFTFLEYDPKLHNITNKESKIGWGHSIIQEGINIANLAGINKLVSFHYAPESTDKKITDIVKYAKQYLELFDSDIEIIPSYEGLEIEV